MGLLDEIVGAVGKQVLGSGNNNQLVETVINMISSQQGGLAGLAEKFNAGGLAKEMASWISTGDNLPVQPDQLQNALGSDVLQDIASKVGLNPDGLSGQLASILPTIIDKLTPDGKIPEAGSGGLLEMGLDLLKNKLSS